MEKLRLIFIALFISFVFYAHGIQLDGFLQTQHIIKSVDVIPGNSFFNETYKIMVRQPLDHSDTTKGFFLQRVFVSDKGSQNPVLLITEGYAANYAKSPKYINELSPMFDSNQICVEHRYFGESWPDSINWNYLTVENAAADHHKIVELFKNYYKGKWINTGISKGGQTAVYHRSFYPNDVDVTVAYVCPLNFGIEDGRHEPFIKKIPGTPEQREKIEAFQLQVLKNRDLILPKLNEYSKEKQYTYRISLDKVLDYCVLEYSFSLWQWGRYFDEIPPENAEIDILFDHLMKVAASSYFAIEGIEGIKSFFVQAAREEGYYGYNTKPFKKYLSIKTSKNYLEQIFIPKDEEIKFIKSTYRLAKKFIKNTDEKILFIYGEFDPWLASGFVVPEKDNFLKVIKPGGSHLTRIKNMPENQQNLIRQTLENWLNTPINIKKTDN